VRIAFFALLLVNLVFFAWAHWVDVPTRAPASEVEKLPRLKLAEEVPAAERSQPMHNTSLSDPSPCLSIGPFADYDGSGHAAALLREKGFEPKPRAAEGESSDGYWVFVGGLKSEGDADKALVTLEHIGIKDAVLMPEIPDAGRRLSLGMYSERARAEKRAQTVRDQTGLKADVAARKLAGTSYWLDISAPAGVSAAPLRDILAGDAGPQVTVQPCPASSVTAPPTGTATAHPSPHAAATAAASTGAPAATQLR
jgi:hypothetical protein